MSSSSSSPPPSAEAARIQLEHSQSDGSAPVDAVSNRVDVPPAGRPSRLALPSTQAQNTPSADLLPGAGPSLHDPLSDRAADPPLSPRSTRLSRQLATLSTTLLGLRAQVSAAQTQLADPNAAATVRAHVERLHRYNEIKDVGMGLLGLIAEREGRRLADVMEDHGVSRED